jgi:hypothetical protein
MGGFGFGMPFWGFGRPYGFYRPHYYRYRRSGCSLFFIAAFFLFILLVSHLWVLIVPLAVLAVAGIMLFSLARRHRVPNANQPYYNNQQPPYPNQGQGYPYNPNYPSNPNQPYTQNGPYNPNNGYPY